MSRELTPQEAAERSLIKKYRKELWNPFIAAVKRYELIAPGDRIAVCISGGKDSVVLAKLMQELQRITEQPFELVFLVMDPGYAPANRALIEENAAAWASPSPCSGAIFSTLPIRWRRTPATYAPGCAGAFCTARLRSWAATRSPWGTISPTCWRPRCWACFTVPSSQTMPPQAPQQKFPRHGIDPSAVLCP